MENSAYEALITGVNLTIFVIATTVAIILFTTVLDLSDLASDSVIEKSTGSVIVSSSELQKRTVTGSELISYYTNYKKENDILKVWISNAVQQDLGDYIESQNINNTFANKKFEIYLDNIAADGKETYVFKVV